MSELDALVDVRRSAWGGGARPRPLIAVEHPRLEVHHSGVDAHYDRDPLEVAAAVERDHLGRGWNGSFYSLMVATDGRIIELRGVGWRSIGEHRARYTDGTLVDPAALTVLLPGNYLAQRTTEPQRRALERLRARVPDPVLRTHGERDETACPGTNARALVRLLNDRPAQPAPPLPLEEDPDMLFIAIRPDGHRELSDGFRRRPFADWTEMTRYRDGLGLRSLSLTDAEFARLRRD